MSQSGVIVAGTVLPEIETLSGNVGGPISGNAAFNINLLGVGPVTVTGNPATNTLSISVVGMGLTWTREVLAAVAMASDHGYVNTNAGLTTFTLPVAAALGTVIEIAGESAGLWSVAQNALQSIRIGNDATTVGIGGSITATNRYDSIRLICRVADTTWQATTSPVGVLNIV